ncbi:hypothetical protein ColTof4_11095 [Colletotrichum tofieldiae]|nr:hypothetical protein ColTof3_04279 [Colletotrichum tofieldiae]GKT78672.1 hypothetical protein ColTof4_11095 [Colletotrichum tofieldiae]
MHQHSASEAAPLNAGNDGNDDKTMVMMKMKPEEEALSLVGQAFSARRCSQRDTQGDRGW